VADLFTSVDLPLCPRSKHAPKREKQEGKTPDPWFRTFCPVCQTVGAGASTQDNADIGWRTLCEKWNK
jgi:hypothetical protein